MTKPFDPNSTATTDSGIFGLPFSESDSKLCLLPVPWEATTSYGDGASQGPAAVLEGSMQVDLFDIETGDVYKHGYFLLDHPVEVEMLNSEASRLAEQVVEAIEAGDDNTDEVAKLRKQVNAASSKVNTWVYETTKSKLASGKLVGVIGGDHSSPFGAIQALSEKFATDFGILHIDAHADLRDAYQGFQFSHASIMHNVMESKFAPKKLVQVGIRDFSPGEKAYIEKNPSRIQTFFDIPLKRRLLGGESWIALCKEIVGHLPQNVYISWDIDGLEPDLCPNTGTPVPGGMSFDQALTLLSTLGESGRKIIGFDLCEVAAPADRDATWDGNVGARILFKLCGWTMVTNGMK